jgi:gliding motility-associated-like protein
VINITWTPSKSKKVKYYFIERSDDGITYKPVTGAMPPTQLSYTDKKVFVDSFYYNYRIKVQDSCGDMSVPSNVGRSILLFIDTNSNGYPTLTWTPYLDWPEGVDHYTVELRDNNGVFKEVFKTNTGAINEHTDELTDLNTQKDYCYRVIAHRASPPSTPGINDTISSMSNVTCTPLQSVLFVPDAFTPNGDDYNNVFFVKGQYLKEYTLKIFDRWGTLVFESTDIDEGWDGTNKYGTMCPMDVYVYLITTRGADNKYRVTRGTITMMP